MRTTFTILSAIVVLGAAVVFGIFISDTVRLHGDALSGREADGRFYVADHGRETEVSEADWRRNRALEIAMIVTAPLGMIAGFYLLFGVGFPRVVFRGTSHHDRASRVQQVATSGPAIASTNCSGSFGWFSAGGGMVHADVHPAGLVVRVRMVGTVAVRREELRGIVERKQLVTRFVEIEHASDQLSSPVRLACARDVAFTEALRSLVARTQTAARVA